MQAFLHASILLHFPLVNCSFSHCFIVISHTHTQIPKKNFSRTKRWNSWIYSYYYTRAYPSKTTQMSLNINHSNHKFPNYINIFAYLLKHPFLSICYVYRHQKINCDVFLQKQILFKGIFHKSNNCSPNVGLHLWFIHFKCFQLKNPNC